MMASTNTFKKSVATYTKPDFMLLNQWLEPLVDWQSFGLLLPGITQWNIITIQQLNAKHQKLALFTKWLNTDPTATWRDVLNALTKREEINLLQTINDQLQVHQCTRGREVDESNKSSIQSSESEKEESKKKMTKAMQMEIDHLRSSLQSKAGIEETLIGVEKTLIEREKEIELLQEKISLMNIQQLKETSITLSMYYIILT
ncbi:PREDICTED: uncharacterized protein LOC109589607 [Amphimedon queenslandica]|uniref:Death domain-containing protein n=1 Tax=Amphimedon queenslandica TaxID=400682 RepID=A0AAN0JWE3_AMPQE|nr:PREDICTED: uncharacterized protein LOC109589607 [Amphimedon queenslandica]|eukprot:XP_019861225.1 PREDICTED: uncharacterized protein LOC109589607 [Amphimedon queenslandica]